MDKNKGWLIASLVVFVILAVVLAVVYSNANTKKNDLTIQVGLLEADIVDKDLEIGGLEDDLAYTELTVANLNTDVEALNTAVGDALVSIESKDTELADLGTRVVDLEAQIEIQETTEAMFENSYLFDGIALSATLDTKELNDRHLKTLFDGEISFDGDEYGAVETITLSDLTMVKDDEDFKGEVFMEVPSSSIEYKVELRDGLFDDFKNSGYEDKEFTISFLGKDLTITNWTSTCIDIKRGETYNIKEGESELVNEKLLEVLFVSNDNEVIIGYDGVTETIKELKSENVNGLDIYVESIMYNSKVGGLVTLRVGSNVDETYTSGKPYSKDSDYIWEITNNSIGIVLDEKYTETEEDEEYRALAYGQALSLPEDFAMVSFELSDEDYASADIEFESATEINFEAVFEDAEGDLVFNGTEFVDEDNEGFGTKIQFEDSDFYLQYYKGTWANWFLVDDVQIAYNIDGVFVNFENYTTSDVDVMSNNGLVVSAPDDDLEHGKLSIEVPEEAVKALVSVTMG